MTKNLGPSICKIKIQEGDQIIQPFCRIGSPQKIRSPIINLMNFQKAEKSTAESCRMNWNLMNDKEFGCFKLLKLKYRRGNQIIHPFCRIGSPQENRPHLFNLMSFQKGEKSTAESYRMHWNLMNNDEFGSLKFLKLKYKWGDQIIRCSGELLPPKKLGPPSLIWQIFRKLRKLLLLHLGCIEI